MPNVNLSDPKLYINRELSLLDFNERVLANARDPRHPLLERVRFLAISETNMDEFYMIRVAGLLRQVESERSPRTADGTTPQQALQEIHARVGQFFAEQRRVLREDLLPLLDKHGVHLVPYKKLSRPKQQELRRRFKREMLPILTPLAIDPSHPFPHISNLSLNLLVVIREKDREVLARLKVPNTLPRFLHVTPPAAAASGNGYRPVELVRLEEVIAANLDELFPGHAVLHAYVFQVTRDADLVIQEDEASDLLRAVQDELDQRRFGDSVRLVVNAEMPERVRGWLARHLGIDPADVYVVTEPIGLGQLAELTHLDRPDLLYPPVAPHVPAELSGADTIFEAVQQGDVLLYHPYDSFAPVLDFVRSAASDLDVLAVKQTLYRVGTRSPIVEALLEARDEDTQVAVLVELKARFDEESNITWARQLESQGVHVAYGIVGLKTHAKLCLIVRKETDGIRRYVHLGTGNYNPGNARVYTDFSLFTDDPEIAEDVSDLFNYLTGYSKQDEYARLLVAPVTLRKKLLRLIAGQKERAEQGKPARIVAKMNQLADPQIIKALYRASQAGVKIELLVRSFCCLRPGVPGVSENIRVVSIVGRFLEHARVYEFGAGDDSEMYLGSADLMERNLDRRVETLFPVRDPQHRARVRQIMRMQLEDNINAWELGVDRKYRRIVAAKGEAPCDSQAALLQEPVE